MKHRIDYRVYYENTDAGGIKYHGSFINFCERGRTELLRELGFRCSDLYETEKIQFVVRHMECDYYKPGKLDDLLTVESSIKALKNTSFVMKQSIFRHDLVLFSTSVTLVCVNEHGKPVRIPDKIRHLFKDYLEEDEE